MRTNCFLKLIIKSLICDLNGSSFDPNTCMVVISVTSEHLATISLFPHLPSPYSYEIWLHCYVILYKLIWREGYVKWFAQAYTGSQCLRSAHVIGLQVNNFILELCIFCGGLLTGKRAFSWWMTCLSSVIEHPLCMWKTSNSIPVIFRQGLEKLLSETLESCYQYVEVWKQCY